MSHSSSPLFQGRNWFTYRWSIAEAFDALDRFHDLCLSQEWLETSGMEEIETTVLPILQDFTNDLTCMLAIACADTTQTSKYLCDIQHGWHYIEIQWWMKLLVKHISALPEQSPPNFESITLVIAELKRLVGAIDT